VPINRMNVRSFFVRPDPDDPASAHYDPDGRQPETAHGVPTASHPGRPEYHP
jgi:hypothetical protein